MKMKVNSIIVLLTLCLLVTACRRHAYHDLEQVQAGSLRIEFDWNGYTDIPPGMNLMFYPVVGQGMEDRKPFMQQVQYDGGRISLSEGCYNVAVYNDYTYDISFRGMEEYSTAEAYLTEYNRMPLATKITGYNALEPDLFYTARMEGLVVTSETKGDVITIRPQLNTLTLRLHVRGTGFKNVRMADAVVSGIARSVRIASGWSEEVVPSNIIFPLKTGNDELTASVRVFLLRNYMEADYKLSLAFMLKNNTVNTEEYTFNITSQLLSALSGTEGKIPPEGIDIYIDGIFIEQTPETEGGGGFDIGIEGWGNVVDTELE